MQIQTFQGLVPAPSKHASVASVPYDVVNREEATAEGKKCPESFIHVVRAEIDLPAEVDAYDDAVYARAKENLGRLTDNGVLVREEQPSLYLYQQRDGDHVQTGIVCTCHIDDYASNIIRKHEKTRPAKEDDRTRLGDTLGANTGPVFLTYRQTDLLRETMAKELEKAAPDWEFTADDGVVHAGWRVTEADAARLVEGFAEVSLAYVADGHHRSASAHRVGSARRAANPDHCGSEPYNWFLCVLFPADQLRILPYNRVVRDLNGLTPMDLLEALSRTCEVSETAIKSPSSPRSVSMFLDGQWFALELRAAPDAGPVESLDVSILQEQVLTPLLGIGDPRTDTRIDFVGGIRGPEELERLVESGEFAVGFSMFPVSVDELMEIADADQIMAPKSTWFEPKLRSGLFVHTIDD